MKKDFERGAYILAAGDFNRDISEFNFCGDGHACARIADILEGKEYQPWVAE